MQEVIKKFLRNNFNFCFVFLYLIYLVLFFNTNNNISSLKKTYKILFDLKCILLDKINFSSGFFSRYYFKELLMIKRLFN